MPFDETVRHQVVILILYFFAAIRRYFNELNFKLPGHGELASILFDHMKVLKWKQRLLQKQVNEESIVHFEISSIIFTFMRSEKYFVHIKTFL